MSVVSFDSSTDVPMKHKPLFDRVAGKSNTNTFVLSGGRSSFKSYDVCLAILIDMLVHASKGEPMNAVVFVNQQTDIRDGVHKQFRSVIADEGLDGKFVFRYSPAEIRFENGATVYFYGLNGQDGKKTNAVDNIGWIWFEEFDQFESRKQVDETIATFDRHNIPSEAIKFVYTFNPPSSRHHWIFEYLKNIRAEKIHTTYLDDLNAKGKNVLDKSGERLINNQQLERINAFKQNDYAWYSWNYLGIVPSDAESDFPNLVEPENPLELTEDDFLFAGVDSATKGKDSTVLTVLAYNAKDYTIKFLGIQYFDDVWVDGVTSYKVAEDIATVCRSMNVNALYVDPMQGQHIIDYMLMYVPEITTRPNNFGGARSDRASGRTLLATNRRAEMYVNTSEQLKSGRVFDYGGATEIEKQLDATDLIMDARSIKVVSKDVIKARIGHSPDEADSFVLAMQAVYDIMKL